MKSFKSTILKTKIYSLALAAVFTIVSCDQNVESKDTKEIAEDINEEKFEEDKEKDAEYLVSAAEIDLVQIKLGQLAQKNSSSEDVKALGKMMEVEHTKALKELNILASKKQIIIPATLTNDGEKAYDKLQEKKGADFDKEYCEMMVNGHKDGVEEFEKVSTDASDAAIRDWAGALVVLLKKHHEHSVRCKEKCEAKEKAKNKL
jgi:putative membrane protein